VRERTEGRHSLYKSTYSKVGAHLWNFLCDNSAREALQDCRLANTRWSNKLYTKRASLQHDIKFTPQKLTTGLDLVLRDRTGEQISDTGKNVLRKSLPYFGWYAGFLDVCVQVDDPSRQKRTFVSPDGRVQFAVLHWVIDWMEIWKETVNRLMIELQNKMVDMTYALLVDWKGKSEGDRSRSE